VFVVAFANLYQIIVFKEKIRHRECCETVTGCVINCRSTHC
jgi:hypothetical protein